MDSVHKSKTIKEQNNTLIVNDKIYIRLVDLMTDAEKKALDDQSRNMGEGFRNISAY